MSKKMDGFDVAALAIMFFIGYPLAICYEAWIVVKMWGWFVLPTFPTAPQLTMAAAAGLGLLIVLIRPVPMENKADDEATKIAGRALGYWFLSPSFILVTATAIHVWFQ